MGHLWSVDPEVGDGTEPDGLCGNKNDHDPHLHNSPTLGRFWCQADQSKREPYASELRRSRQ